MPVVALDARLLEAGPPALDAALAEHLGAPLLLRIEGLGPQVAPDVGDCLREVPALTLGVGPDATTADASGAVDLATADADQADAWCATFHASPEAAHAAALLVRHPSPDVWSGLVHESATYSMLQSGPVFQAWSTARAPKPTRDDKPRVRVVRHDAVTEITLIRPARHNALDTKLRDELHPALAEAQVRSGPVIVRAEGPSFCSGGDLDQFGTFPDPARAHAIRLGRSLAWQFHLLRDRLVVGLHGACLGAGIELPAFTAHVVAADDTRCGLPELAMGLVPGSGGTVSIPRRVGRARFLELMLLDGTVDATTAHEWGLVDEVVPVSDLDARLLEVAESLR